MTKRTAQFSPEVRERAVRMVRDHEGEHGPQWSAIQSIAAKIGCSGETLRNWVRQFERDQGVRPGQTTDERERIKALEREVRELQAFVFRGRQGHLIKVLWWDGQGLCLFAKRLEKGRFVWPATAGAAAALTPAQLAMLLEGIDWRAPVRTDRPRVAG
jgi:transposase